MRKLKIAFIVPSFPTVSETFIVNQLTDLIDRGHQVKIIAFYRIKNPIVHQKIRDYELLEKTIYLEDVKISKVRRYLIFFHFIYLNRKEIKFGKLRGMFNYPKYGKIALNLRDFLNYKRISDEGEFDIFHAHFGSSGAFIAKMKSFGFWRHTKLVVSFHGHDLSPHQLSSLKISYRSLFKEADLLTVNSKYTKSILKKITAKSIEILPVGLNTSEFIPKQNKNEKFNILFVGRLIPFKAPDLAVEIAQRLHLKNYSIHLDIIGVGEMFWELKEYIKIERLQDIVGLKGALSQEEIRKYMELSDVLILPGIYDEDGRAETQGLVIQEAQAMELPVLVSDVGGMKYGLIDGETGFVVGEKDIDGFVNKLEVLYKNRKLRQSMGKKGREFVKKNFDSHHLGNQLEEYYYRLKPTYSKK